MFFVTFLAQPLMSLFRSGILVGIGTLLSRITGLIREILIASVFGTSNNADMVNIALKLPNLFRRIFAEGALSSVFIPMLEKKKKLIIEEQSVSKQENSYKLSPTNIQSSDYSNAQFFFQNINIWLCAILISFISIITIFMKPLMLIIAPGFIKYADKIEQTTFLCRITLPYLFFISISALWGGVLNSENKFFPFAFVPCLLNISIIFFTLILIPYISPSKAISISVIIGGGVQLLFMYFFIRQTNFKIKIHKPILNNDVISFFKNMVPVTISASIIQLNLFISQSIASFATGAISILSYADRIYQLPLSLIGTTLSTILLPELSKLNHLNHEQSMKVKNNALKFAYILAIPSSVGLFSLNTPIVELLYQRGAFTLLDTINTAKAISVFCLGIPAFILHKVYTSILYSHMNIKPMLKITIYSLIINITVNIILVSQLSYIGIALGSVVAGWYNTIALHRIVMKHQYLSISKKCIAFFIKVLLISLAMGFIVKTQYEFIYTNISTYNIIARYPKTLMLINSKMYNLICTVTCITTGIIIYAFGLILTKTVTLKNKRIQIVD